MLRNFSATRSMEGTCWNNVRVDSEITLCKKKNILETTVQVIDNGQNKMLLLSRFLVWLLHFKDTLACIPIR